MSAFAALSGIGGDDDYAALQKKKVKSEKDAKEREAAASKQRFEDLRNRSATNWGDSDDDEDFFKSPPKCDIAPSGADDADADGNESEELSEQEEEEEAAAPTIAAAPEPARVYQKSAKELEKEEAKKKKDEELENMMAELHVTKDKENAEGMSKAAQKRAKKKAAEAATAGAPSRTDAGVKPEVATPMKTDAVDAEEDSDAGTKSAEEVKQMLLARAEALKKKKAKAETAKKASAAAAAAELKARGKAKKKTDKSKFNQQPPSHS